MLRGADFQVGESRANQSLDMDVSLLEHVFIVVDVVDNLQRLQTREGESAGSELLARSLKVNSQRLNVIGKCLGIVCDLLIQHSEFVVLRSDDLPEEAHCLVRGRALGEDHSFKVLFSENS